MNNQRTYRVFVSYTGNDLEAHAGVVANVLKKLEHLAIDHKDSGATGEPSVQWCMDQVDQADFLVVLVAHRYGWVPSPVEGGDGRKSITRIEVDRAIASQKIVLPYIIDDDARWPGNKFEGLTNPQALSDLNQFKSDLRRSVAAFFSDPISLDGPLSRDIPRAISRIEKKNIGAIDAPREKPGSMQVVPWHYSPDDPPTLGDRMAAGLPKRVLSLEGGGVESAVMYGYLEKIERLLQVRYSDARFKLADYFDLIGGVGPSAVLALELARRKSVSDAFDTLRAVFEQGYRKRMISFAGMLAPIFADKYLEQTLEKRFGEIALTDSSFTTGFALLSTSLNRGQPVVISNHPALARTFAGHLTVSFAAKASLAAPGYFSPVIIREQSAEVDALSDGRTSIGRDPSLALLLLVSSPNFNFRWRLGQHRLLVTAVGFHLWRPPKDVERMRNGGLSSWLGPFIESLLQGASYQSRAFLDALASNGATLDAAEQDQSATITFRRYAASIDPETLKSIGMPDAQALLDAEVGVFKNFDRFVRVGQLIAERQLAPEDFQASFDVRLPVGSPSGINQL